MQKNISFGLEEVQEIPNWAESYKAEKFSVMKCCFLSTRENSHKIKISEEVLRKNASSILGSFLVAKIEFGDATTHKPQETIFGYFPMSQEIEFVNDGDIVKAYAYAVISKKYGNEINEIFAKDNLRNTSVEMTVEFADEEESEAVSFEIYGLTVLGKFVNGSCPDADAKIVRFSETKAEKYFRKNTVQSSLKDFMQERKTLMAGKTYKIDKSKEALSEKDWGEVDKTELRNTIMEADNRKELVEACYMLVEDGWEETPSEHLKYPVMCFENEVLVYNRYGLASALAYAKKEEEQSVIDKVEKIYKQLDLQDDSERKEDEEMSEIEFSAVDIGYLWNNLWNAIHARYPDGDYECIYRIEGIYEEGNKKFAIIKKWDETTLYRLDFTLTEEGLTLSDEIVKVEVDIVETDDIKKFAELEDADLMKKFTQFEEKTETEDNKEDKEENEEEEKDEDEETQLAELNAKLEQLQKDIEERDHIIMDKDKELEELRAFKESVESKERAMSVEAIMEDVKDCLSEEQFKQFREEGLNCAFAELDAWSNTVKAVAFSAMKKPAKKSIGNIWAFAATTETHKEKGLWDR